MRRSRKVKILATIGPASSSEEMLKKLFEAGADVFRINMSHTDHELMRTLVGRIRTVEEAVGRPIGILADLQGPKLRVGKFANGKEVLTPGQTFTLDDNPEPGTSTRVYLPHPEILSSVEAGDRLLIDDGKLELKAVKSDGKVDRLHRRRRHHHFRQEGRQPARHRPAGRRADRKGPQGPRCGAGHWRRLGGAVVRAAAGGSGGSAQDRARPGAHHGQDRKAAGRRPAGRDHRTLGRA